VYERAQASAGSSTEPVLLAVEQALETNDISGDTVIDLGAGQGQLWPHVQTRFKKYIGVDVFKFDNFPDSLQFVAANLDEGLPDIAGDSADLVVAVETIEHLENPRFLFREMVRLTKPQKWLIVTTPNQTSALSKLTLMVKNQFNAFQEVPGQYPAHLTALLPVDLVRMAKENGLVDIRISYSRAGRIPGTARHYPTSLSRLAPRSFSDNVVITARKP
jgi:2-polyprenyl-3-methyl-5-hydroxy-6-metoxy-1,4-benzoquinol methylase